jgi:hypothetical protein
VFFQEVSFHHLTHIILHVNSHIVAKIQHQRIMIRAKMQAKFGNKSDAAPPPPGEEGEQSGEILPEESAEQEESEALMVTCFICTSFNITNVL